MQGSRSPEPDPVPGTAGPGDPGDRRAGVSDPAAGRPADSGTLVDAARATGRAHRAGRAAVVVTDRDAGDRGQPAPRRTAGLAPGPDHLSRPASRAGAGNGAVGVAAGGRWCRVAAGVWPARPARQLA